MPEDTKKPTTNQDHMINNVGRILNVDIVPEMKKSYLDYAMSVIVSRALPDVRDGLKPVHRRIIYAMDKMGLTPGGKNVKSAAVVGDVLKSYHPHGDAAVYMSLVRMAQDFSLRYPLVKGQGNFGSIDGDPPAAMRYTEVKMSKLTPEMVADIDKETVLMVDNYDATIKEPSVLPSRVPNLLLNGADGIAVGMATRIPPHNLQEICQAINFILDNCKLETVEDTSIQNLVPVTTQDKVLVPVHALERLHFNFETTASVDQLLEHIKGPDFPTAGEIYGVKGIKEMFQTGRGKFVLRGKAVIDETKSGKIRIIISQLPYQVNKAELVKKIADLVRDKKILGISDLRDESDRDGIRVVIELKKNSRPKTVLNKLYKYTSLQVSYSAHLLALVESIPQTLNLRQLLLLFLRHRETIVRRRTIFDLKSAYLKAHILLGLKKALDHLDEVIKTIRASKTADDARQNLMAKFDFTDLQANAILEMQLRRLAALERQKIEDDLADTQKYIDELTAIVTTPTKMIKVLRGENDQIAQSFPSPRLTKIYQKQLEDFSEADLIPNEPCVLTVTKSGYIKRIPKDSFRSQGRGGMGVSGMTTKTEDEIDAIFSVSTHDDLLFFTNRGRCFHTKVWEITEGNRHSKGQSIVNVINTTNGETIQATLPIPQDKSAKYVLLGTKNGVVKKTDIEKFRKVRQNGLAAINLDQGDELIWAHLTSGEDHIFLVTQQGKCIRFSENDIRPIGRHARGVRGILLKTEDEVTSIDIIPPKSTKDSFYHVLTISQRGIGKRTDVYQYPLQKRGGVGVKVAAINTKTGPIAASRVVSSESQQVLIVSKKAITIKLSLKNIPALNRSTQGVILMRFKSVDDRVVNLAIIQETLADKPAAK